MYFFFMKEIPHWVWYFLVTKFMAFLAIFWLKNFVGFFKYIYVLFKIVCCRNKTKSNKDIKIQIFRIHKKTEPYGPYLVKCHKYVQCKLCDDKKTMLLFFFYGFKRPINETDKELMLKLTNGICITKTKNIRTTYVHTCCMQLGFV